MAMVLQQEVAALMAKDEEYCENLHGENVETLDSLDMSNTKGKARMLGFSDPF